jgi:hypothetical protein
MHLGRVMVWQWHDRWVWLAGGPVKGEALGGRWAPSLHSYTTASMSVIYRARTHKHRPNS